MRWTAWVDDVGRPGHENMAVDDALLRTAREGVGVLRLYRWDPPCLSFGRHEPATRRYDADAIARLGLDTVRRPTGGRAVWHDREITYAVAAPLDTFGPLAATYRAIHEMLADALRRVGVPAELAPRPAGPAAGPAAGACFALPAGGEVVVSGRKLIGSAQFRDGAAFLQHGSILMDDGQDVVSQVTRGAAPPIAATSLRAVVGRDLGFATVADAIVAAAMDAWPGTWIRGSCSLQHQEPHKFEDAEWTWRR